MYKNHRQPHTFLAHRVNSLPLCHRVGSCCGASESLPVFSVFCIFLPEDYHYSLSPLFMSPYKGRPVRMCTCESVPVQSVRRVSGTQHADTGL